MQAHVVLERADRFQSLAALLALELGRKVTVEVGDVRGLVRELELTHLTLVLNIFVGVANVSLEDAVGVEDSIALVALELLAFVHCRLVLLQAIGISVLGPA